MRAAVAEGEAAVRYPIRGIFVGCCASATPHNRECDNESKSPTNFGFSILDFRLSDKNPNRSRDLSSSFPYSKIGNRKSKMLI